MRLSTAMLKGSKGRVQTTNTLRDNEGAVCALGAACYGVGIIPRVGTEFSNTLVQYFPILRHVKVLVDGRTKNLQTIIASKNDTDDWGIRRIANWLRRFGF